MFFSFSDIQAPTDHRLAPFLFDGQPHIGVNRKYPLAPQAVGPNTEVHRQKHSHTSHAAEDHLVRDAFTRNGMKSRLSMKIYHRNSYNNLI